MSIKDHLLDMNAKTVFISYRRGDGNHFARSLENELKHRGYDVFLDVESTGAGVWPPRLLREVQERAHFILVLTPRALDRCTEPDDWLRREFELAHESRRNIVPVRDESVVVEEMKKTSPECMRAVFDYEIAEVRNASFNRDIEWLVEKFIAPHKAPSTSAESSKAVPDDHDGPDKISISRLPVTGPNLFGRGNELKLLDKAWGDPKTKVTVLTLVAWGGVGKSALVNYWLRQMSQDHYRGAKRVYAWSFDLQGRTEGTLSADLFIDSGLRFFDDPNPTQGSAWDKGYRLAQLIRQQRTLLILDGLESLQYAPGLQGGALKDQALITLLRELAEMNPGLCIVSTRVPVSDLKDFENSAAPPLFLEDLSQQAGAQLLRAQGANGEEKELEEAAKEFGGHSLTLILLGSYLKDVFGGDVRYRREVHLTEDVQHGEQAHRVMAAYETQLRKPELAVLRMLGLFNRPADKQAIAALRAEPGIPGLTDALQPLNRREWQQALANLRRAGLLAESDQFDTLDTHPLVREHFGQQLRRELPDACREGNKRLYEHFKRTAKEFPDTIEEMSPLYAAVAHGCEAGRYQEAFDEVYWGRISRGEDYHSMDRLGALDSDLAVLTNFFVEPWAQPVAALTETTKARVLSLAGYCLKALGRLSEADTPLQAAFKTNISQENWKDAADNADYLSGLSLLRGDPDKALKYAEEGVEQADQSGDYLQRVTNRSRRASVLHYAGLLTESKAGFLAAEQIQKEQEPHSPFLYSFRGFWYCDLLLDEGNYLEVITRAEQALKRARERGALIDRAEDHLSLGRAYLLQAQDEHTGNYERASTHMTEAVDGLRQAHYQDHLISGLLARSKLRRVEGAFELAETDLKQAMSIAERSKMLPLLADCYLEYARLYLAQGQREKAGQSLATAETKIKTIGYHRRDKEVAELEATL